MVFLLYVLACSDGKITVGDDPPVEVEPALTVAGPAALDPLYGTPATFALSRTGGDTVSVTVLDATGAVVRTLADGSAWADTLAWDGRDDAGTALPMGRYTLHGDLAAEGATVASSDTLVDLVRVGASAGTLGGDRIPLMWHQAGGAGMYWDDGGDTATFTLAALDVDGVVTPIPAPWDDLDTRPEDLVGQNLPAAYAWDARPTLSLVVGGDVGSAVLTPAIDGWTLTAGTVAPGETVVLTADAPLATGPGVIEETLELRWMAARPDGGEALVGTQDLPLRVYALLGAPTFEETGAPYLPWVAVIDPALRAIGGVEATEVAVISALVAHIYFDLGLSYDTRWGASSYTQYDGNTFNDANFDLSSFLARSRGSVINCTDCASILEAFANMLGATLSYTILLPSFDLNYIKAIGGDRFDHCPFDSGGCGFSYHAVTTPDDGGTIYDATLALDGDADPGTYPGEELLVQAISGDEYLERLVDDGDVRYRYTQKETLQ
ncbi:MAG: FlgD immunoglobulin-like domain containing protein [Pseudomonadota bacterium]|nr:FlgD immunoglobulin-like domain containing protein [Pseudomonadota bacterium]